MYIPKYTISIQEVFVISSHRGRRVATGFKIPALISRQTIVYSDWKCGKERTLHAQDRAEANQATRYAVLSDRAGAVYEQWRTLAKIKLRIKLRTAQ